MRTIHCIASLPPPRPVFPVLWAFNFDLWDEIIVLLSPGPLRSRCPETQRVSVTYP